MCTTALAAIGVLTILRARAKRHKINISSRNAAFFTFKKLFYFFFKNYLQMQFDGI